MALIRSLAVWVIIYASQCWLGYVNKWHLESVDFYIFYAVATLMMVISYVMGRIEEIKEDTLHDEKTSFQVQIKVPQAGKSTNQNSKDPS